MADVDRRAKGKSPQGRIRLHEMHEWVDELVPRGDRARTVRAPCKSSTASSSRIRAPLRAFIERELGIKMPVTKVPLTASKSPMTVAADLNGTVQHLLHKDVKGLIPPPVFCSARTSKPPLRLPRPSKLSLPSPRDGLS